MAPRNSAQFGAQFSETPAHYQVHEFLPDVLERVDAVFLTHRDPRDALLSSAQKISSCLAYGTQPLLSAFAHYASWYPHACHDMRYEDMIAGGAARTLRAHLRRLGLPHGPAALVDLVGRLHDATEKPKPTEADAAKTGLMPGHKTFLTTDPAAHDVFSEYIGQGVFSKYCNLTAEVALIEEGWGRWLVAQGYEPAGARFEGNAMVDSLPQARILMGAADEEADGEGGGGGGGNGRVAARCPLQSDWRDALAASGVWRYSRLRVNRSKGAPHWSAEQEAAAQAEQRRQQRQQQAQRQRTQKQQQRQQQQHTRSAVLPPKAKPPPAQQGRQAARPAPGQAGGLRRDRPNGVVIKHDHVASGEGM